MSIDNATAEPITFSTGSVDKTYKNTIPLYAYALAQYEYNSEDKSMYDVNEYLELISEDYNGELCEEIKTFKGTSIFGGSLIRCIEILCDTDCSLLAVHRCSAANSCQRGCLPDVLGCIGVVV